MLKVAESVSPCFGGRDSAAVYIGYRERVISVRSNSASWMHREIID